MKKIFIASLFAFSVFALSATSAHAATLYFNAGANHDWNTRVGNWWTNSGFSSQAGSLPGVGDDVIISGYVTSNSGPSASVNTMTVNNTRTTILITVANGATFNDSSNTGTITGSTTFNGSSSNQSAHHRLYHLQRYEF